MNVEKTRTWRLAVIMAGVLSLLASCRTVVPEPTFSLQNRGVPHPSYSLRLVGPQLETPTFSAKFTDLNQDGHLDILVGGRGLRAGFSFQQGDGAGRWASFAGPKTDMQPRDFDVADVNQDGQLMVLIGGQGDTKGLQVWQPQGVKWKLHSAPTESGIYHNVRFSDINADGWPDIVAAKVGVGAEAGGINIWLNDGKGGWHEDAGPMHQGQFVDMDIADLDADGNLDIIAAERGGIGSREASFDEDWHWVGGVRIWYGDGEGRWTQEILPVDADVDSVTVADVNGDGTYDVVAGLYQRGLRLFLQHPGGVHGRTMAWKRQVIGGNREVHAITEQDRSGITLDGKHDDAPGYDSKLHDQTGEWRREAVVYKGSWHDVRVGDLNGDGRQELIAASSTGQGIGLWSWSPDRARLLPWRGQLPDYDGYQHLDLGDVFDRGVPDVLAVREDGGVEVWSTSKSQPEKTISNNKPLGMPAVVHFDTGSAQWGEKEQQQLANWLHTFGNDLTSLSFKISGHADRRPIRSKIYPDNEALSRARGESIASWLLSHGITAPQITIHAYGAKQPEATANSPEAWRTNRRVRVQAYRAHRSARIPKIGQKTKKRDLFHIDHNAVFKTYNGIPDYIVGPGDKLSFTFWLGGTSTKYEKTVRADGHVSLPYLDHMKVISGMSVMEIGDYITAEIAHYQRNPRVDVVLLKALSKTATIFGQVKDLQRQPTGPGTYYLQGKETLVDFIARTGGPTKDADMTKVQIIRNGKTVILNLNRAISQADWSENAIMDEGDTVFIPSRAQSKHQVFVIGEVGKAGIVEYIGKLSFLEAVSRAGGFTKSSYRRDIRVIRQNRDSPQIIPVNFDRFMHDGDLTQNIILHDKDVVIIPNRPIDNWNRFISDIQPTIDIISSPFTTISNIDTTIKAIKVP